MNLDFTFNILAIPVLLTSLVFLLLAIFTFRRKGDNGEVFFAGLLIGCFVYSLFYGLELLGANEYTIVTTYKLQYVGGILITPFLLLFVIQYSGSHKYISKFWTSSVFLFSGFFLLALFTNDYHNLFYRNLNSEFNGLYLSINYDRGILHIAYESFNNILILISNLILIKMYLSVPKTYRSQVLTLLAGTTFPWLAHSFSLLGFSFYNIDFVPFTLLISAFFIHRGLFSFGLFQKHPIAFKMIFENLTDGIIIFDKKKNIIASNKEAVKILGRSNNQNSSLQELCIEIPELEKLFQSEDVSEVEFYDSSNELFYAGFLKGTGEEDLQYLFL